MDKRLVTLIERAVHSSETVFPLNASWQHLHREYNIGAALSNKIRISARDKQELIELVKQLTGLDLRTASGNGFAYLTRSEALERAHNEKWAGRAVSADRLAIKAMPMRPLRLNGRTLELSGRSHLDIAVESSDCFDHERLLVIENFECFDRIEQMRFILEDPHHDSLVIYRGDPRTSDGRAVNEFLRGSKKPVLALVDLDPAGLLIAQALPGVVGLVSPDLGTLERLFDQGNPDLYHQQRPGTENTLENSPHVVIRRIWALIEGSQKGLVQERWLCGDVELVAHSFTDR